MNAKRFRYMVLVALLVTVPASAQWYVQSQRAYDSAWVKTPHKFLDAQQARQFATFQCGLGNGANVRNVRITGPGQDNVIPCSTLHAQPATHLPPPPSKTSPALKPGLPGTMISVPIPGASPANVIKALADKLTTAISPAPVSTTVPAITKAVTSTPSTAGLDLIGLRLGMSPSVAEQAVRRHMPVGWVYIRDRTKSPGPASTYESLKGFLAADLSEIVLLYFEPSLTQGVLVAVRRHSMLGKSISPAALETVLVQKYGLPTFARNNNWVWGKSSGCSASGVGLLQIQALTFIEGTPRNDRTFRDTIATGLDLATHDKRPPPALYEHCGPVLWVLKPATGVMTTLADQKFAAANWAPERFDASDITF
ncbi:hypothetical protein [Aerolutibacter ruishenii]|uniref:Uncharacterized protein n=1 Tax=Aerolutibacter ruishenii TaxID=686800 RepID=A0A562LWW9_9GAMM|nr:hypothetical protein [Lysobacter ruishenii]TWI12018.1 hypothetical protein IP93_01299 [Lysobacter ruishenii]